MKKIVILFFILITMQTLLKPPILAKAESLNSTEEIETEISNTVNDLLGDLDLSGIDKLYDDEYKIFGNTSFKEKVNDLINGTYFDNYNNIFSAVISLVFDGLASLLPIFLTIIAIAVLSSILNNLKSDSKNNVSQIVNFVCFAVIITILSVNFKNVIQQTSDCLSLMKSQMDAIFPIILTLISAIGGTVSVSIFKPVVAILSNWISSLFSGLLLPIFIISFLFTVIGSLSPNVKLNKFNSFLSSIFKWIVGFVFTMFSSFLAIQGISAGKYDGISIKASKFAIKSYIPIIGGYLSEGLDFIMLGSILIKNAIGVAGLIILFVTILSPLIQILLLKLGLQLVAGIVEPTNNKEISDLISSCSKVLLFPIVLILGVAFMYIISIALLMCTANFV